MFVGYILETRKGVGTYLKNGLLGPITLDPRHKIEEMGDSLLQMAVS